MKVKKFLWIVACLSIIMVFTACHKKEETSSGDNIAISSGETENVESKKIYNNGGKYVSYHGKTYYREYTNASVESEAIGTNFAYETAKRIPKYVNVISPNGKIENLFQDNGYGNFYILDDRFFFEGYSKLYSVNMKGEDYREIATGSYLWCDEENHEIYYSNAMNQNAIYKINTKNLKITKIMNDGFGFLTYDKDNIYLSAKNDKKGIQILKFDRQTEVNTEIVSILPNQENKVEKVDISQYYIASYALTEGKLFLSIGCESGTAHIYTNSTLYVVDLEKREVKKLDENVSPMIRLWQGGIYYTTGAEGINMKKVDTQTLKITDMNSKEELSVESELPVQYQNSLESYVYVEGILKTNHIVFSKEEIAAFKNKYKLLEDDVVTISCAEKVDSKIYFQVEGAKHKEKQDIGWHYAYERIASEIYEYNLETGKKKLIYLYKITDKREESGDMYHSGEEQILEEPLAENEMYLEIKLKDKGLKDTFEVRVEEVGGFIIGKRIEYEGIHTRSEEMLKIKVTKEVGAMLTVYIDNKIDSQMLIEE